MRKRLVKCTICNNIFRTAKKNNDVCQCPHSSSGCGVRFKTKEGLIKL